MQSRQHRAQGRSGRKGKSRKKLIAHQQQQQQQQQYREEDEEEEQERKMEDTGDQDTEGNEESPPAKPSGCFFGVTKFITDNTDLLELVRCAVALEKDKSNGTDSISNKMISGNRKQVQDIEEAPDVSPHQTCNTTTTTTTIPAQVEDSPVADTTFLVNEASLLGLIGLHTCGNLASSSLRLFVANPRVHFLCNVGCCYHLLEEEFSRNTYNQRKTPDGDGAHASAIFCGENCQVKHTGEKHNLSKQQDNAPQSSMSCDEQGIHSTAAPPTTETGGGSPPEQSSRGEKQQEPQVAETAGRGSLSEGDIDPLHPSRIPNLGHGFPLSSFLRERRFSLGRNSRMLSSQATDRLTQGNIVSSPFHNHWLPHSSITNH